MSVGFATFRLTKDLNLRRVLEPRVGWLVVPVHGELGDVHLQDAILERDRAVHYSISQYFMSVPTEKGPKTRQWSRTKSTQDGVTGIHRLIPGLNYSITDPFTHEKVAVFLTSGNGPTLTKVGRFVCFQEMGREELEFMFLGGVGIIEKARRLDLK